MGFRTESTREELALLPEADWRGFLAEVADGGLLPDLFKARAWTHGGVQAWLNAEPRRKEELEAALAARRSYRAEKAVGLWEDVMGKQPLHAPGWHTILRASEYMARHVGVLHDGAGGGGSGVVPVINFVFVSGSAPAVVVPEPRYEIEDARVMPPETGSGLVAHAVPEDEMI